MTRRLGPLLRGALAVAALAWTSAFGSGTALAQGLATVSGSTHEQTENPLGSPPGTRWRNGRERWFLSSRVDGGFFFLRPRVSVGYGRPHYSWTGLDVVPIVSTSAVGGYGGLRIERDFFTFRVGSLYQYSFNRSYLPRQESYDRRDIDLLVGERASYVLGDSELEFYVPFGAFRFRSETQAIYAGLIPDERRLYLDTMWVVIGPGVTLRQRVGFEYFLEFADVGFTPAAELVWLEERAETVLRVGFQARWLLADEFQLRTSVLPVVLSPDSLGRASGDVLEVALRWAWATE